MSGSKNRSIGSASGEDAEGKVEKNFKSPWPWPIPLEHQNLLASRRHGGFRPTSLRSVKQRIKASKSFRQLTKVDGEHGS